jgi:hypothetical protein
MMKLVRKAWVLSFVIAVGMAPLLLYASVSYAVEQQLALTPSMIVNESGKGDAGALVDEQALAGNPAGGTGGSPSTVWFPGWGIGDHPASAYIDLGEEVELTKIYLRDMNSSGDLTVSYGTPGNWTPLFTDNLSLYNVWKLHEVEETTRYLRITRHTVNSNISEIVVYGNSGGGSGVDSTPPATITSLSAGSPTSATVQLSWIASGDDGVVGIASSYDIRYSTSTITEENWSNAVQVTDEPTPAAAGESQSMIVSGLSAGTTYYFAIRASDEVPNQSELSNISSVETISSGAGYGKLVLTTSMVSNESGSGDAGMLVDEQSLSGDPDDNAGGSPTTIWFPGWGSSSYPASAYIDLGQSYHIDKIYLRDMNSSGDVTISHGSPGDWTVMFTDSLTLFKAWKKHDVQATTRYIRVTRASSEANLSEIVMYGQPSAPDTTAPANISNLSAGAPSSSSIQLSWTAPGNDGDIGTASVYDIRYNTSLITLENWDNATQISDEPQPALAGTSQSMTVGGLLPETTYFFSMRAADSSANQSGLSNVATATTTNTSIVSIRIPLTPSMVINEGGYGDAEALVDEQTTAGDPKNAAGGEPTTAFSVGFNNLYHPASAVIDLGAEYTLTDLYIFDGSGGGTFVIRSGTPNDWDNLYSIALNQENAWRSYQPNVTTRYVQIQIPNGVANVNEIVLYGIQLQTPETPPTTTPHERPSMEQFIGINSFVDVPHEVAAVAGFIREYHSWNWDEGDLYPFRTPPYTTGYPGYPGNLNKFNPSYAGDVPWNFDDYYGTLQDMNIVVSPVAGGGSVSWMTTKQNYKPVPSGADPLLPASYAAHADHMYQYAARYGGTIVADNLLKLAPDQPRSTGLNTLQYYENHNEPDKWWETRNGYFRPYEYAAMSSADYDGHLGTMGSTFGIKNADPNAKHVMAGLARPELKYIRALKFWSDHNREGSFPFDVINIHHYSNDGTDQSDGTVGISPEEDDLKGLLKEFVDYRDQYLPGKEVWLTEFGYDTHPESVQRAPAIGATSHEEVQGRWIIRSYMAAAAAGIDRAAMYMIRDTTEDPKVKFNTSGLTKNVTANYERKPSWYYVYTMKNRLSGMQYQEEQHSDDENVLIYKFKHHANNSGAYVVWVKTSNNTVVNDYELALDGTPSSAKLVTLQEGQTNGVESSLTISSNAVTINVSEKPIFIMVDDIE